MLKMRTALFVALTPLLMMGCGYSQEEWNQKVRENERLQSELSAEKAAHAKVKDDYASAQRAIEELKGQLAFSDADRAQQRKALEDYKKRAEQLDALKKRFELLRQKLQKLTQLGLKVEVRNNRMLIQLPGDVLFSSGKADLSKDGEEILAQIAEVIAKDKELAARHYQVAGFTDNAPLSGGPFKDNWGLSAMRARSVLVFLTTPADKKGGGLNGTKWSAAGYGDTDPVGDNSNPDGRKKNRRVEIVVVPNVEEMLDLNSIATP